MIRRRPWSAENKKRVRGLLRVTAYFSFITVACGIVSVRHARAEYENRTLLFGRQMIELAKASNQDLTNVRFNGQKVHVGSSITDDAPESVLRRYEELCSTHRAQTELGDRSAFLEGAEATNSSEAASGSDAPSASGATPFELPPEARAEASELVKTGLVRTGNEDEGVVLCFVRGPKSKPTLTEALQAFLSTGELGALGELRYAYASRGTDGQTHVLTVWTDSAFNFLDMMSDGDEDCAGEDFPEVPRLPSSTRVISASAEGTPYGINVYRTKAAPTKVLEFYDEQMKAAGWFTYDPEMTEQEHKGLGRAYLKNAVVVTVATSKEADGTFVAVGLSGVARDEGPELRLGRTGR